ncbi:MAG: nuclear transport factor 2 family protein [Acidobacteriota bacterium]
MNNLTELIDGYIAMWNEPDAARRDDLIARIWDENASYVDPVLNGEGHAGIQTMVQGVQEKFPGHRFNRTSEVDTHHNQLRFTWALGAEGAEPIVKGTDFGVLAEDGRLQSITGFFDQLPAPAKS